MTHTLLISLVLFNFLLIPITVHTDPFPSFGHERTTRSLFISPDTINISNPLPHLVRRQTTPISVASSYLSLKLGIGNTDFEVQNSYTDEHTGITHVFFMQLVQNTQVTNGLAEISVDRNNNVISFHESFAKKTSVDKLTQRKSILDPMKAVVQVADHLRSNMNYHIPESHLSGMYTAIDAVDKNATWVKGTQFSTDKIWTKSRLMIIQVNDTAAGESLRWVTDVRIQTSQNWFNFQINNNGDGNVVGLVDWTSPALYRVYPSVGFQNDPLEGRASLVQDPEDTTLASPEGWSKDGLTSGNNIVAQESSNGRTRNPSSIFAKGSIDPQLNKLSFDFDVNALSGKPKLSLDGSLTNAFYVTNLMHDILYLYGFREPQGNFQQDNFGRGGLAGDPVIVNVQDDSSRNNANFRTPPDGQQPILNAYLFDASGKLTDGALSNDILFHEYTHGMISRLTGGNLNPNCLSAREAGGMNEGWADMFAIMLKHKAGMTRDTNVAIAPFNTGRITGIRRYLYSTNLKTNPLTYADLPNQTLVHQLGEIWASMLYEVYWNMVDKHQFNSDWRLSPQVAPSGSKLGGNNMFMQILIDGMKLQGCNPTFVVARDAILLADQQQPNPVKNTCEIWRGFAKRGLGLNAGSGKVDYSVPSECILNRRFVKF